MAIITVEYLAYSAGVQSHILLEMVLRGMLPKPEHFIVVNADPGMEDERSYALVAESQRRCAEAGIPFVKAAGPPKDLFTQLIDLPQTHVCAGCGGPITQSKCEKCGSDRAVLRDRMDHPPLWTRNRETGKQGRLMQKCTREFKIRPMKRAVRQWVRQNIGRVTFRTPTERRGRLRHIPQLKVIAWIGFAADEAGRIKAKFEGQNKYLTNRYPLIELQMDRPKVEGFYLKHGIIRPPRSVCVGCFANGLAHYEDMYLNRPNDWDKAVAFDDAARDMRQVGVRDECFVSATLVPLRDLPDRDFLRGTIEGKEHRCNSGVCFV